MTERESHAYGSSEIELIDRAVADLAVAKLA
jgi:hypothetical protein